MSDKEVDFVDGPEDELEFEGNTKSQIVSASLKRKRHAQEQIELRKLAKEFDIPLEDLE